jgi:hypothetical protein
LFAKREKETKRGEKQTREGRGGNRREEDRRREEMEELLSRFLVFCSVFSLNQINSPSPLTFPNYLHSFPSLTLQELKLIIIH